MGVDDTIAEVNMAEGGGYWEAVLKLHLCFGDCLAMDYCRLYLEFLIRVTSQPVRTGALCRQGSCN